MIRLWKCGHTECDKVPGQIFYETTQKIVENAELKAKKYKSKRKNADNCIK